MERNRINLKQLSEILNKELENGNGDAYLFVGEYYITKDSYSIYTDEAVKEKIMSTSYVHVKILTDEENEELAKLSKKDEKKSSKKMFSRPITAWDYGADVAEDDAAEIPTYRATTRTRRGANRVYDEADMTGAEVDVNIHVPTEQVVAEVQNEAINENRNVNEGVDGMYEYLNYLRDVVLRNYPTVSLAFLRRIDEMDNMLNENLLDRVRQEAEILADEMDAIIANGRRAQEPAQDTEQPNLANNDSASWMF